jgi:hypothetical protein
MRYKFFMKTIVVGCFVLIMILTNPQLQSVSAQDATLTPESQEPPKETIIPTESLPPTPTATAMAIATATPEPTQEVQPTAFTRPLIIVDSYDTDGEITPGNDFNLKIKLLNNGGSEAKNVVATFESGDFMPLETGGVISVSSIGAGDKTKINQPMEAKTTL